MVVIIEKPLWRLVLSATPEGIAFQQGQFASVSLVPAPVFHLTVEDPHGNSHSLTSAAGWQQVQLAREGDRLTLLLAEPRSFPGIAVAVTGSIDDTGITWYTEVKNTSTLYSVTMVTYPMPTVTAEPLHLFAPEHSGRALMDVGATGYRQEESYPGCVISMQYCAWWGQKGGIYLGVHDPQAALKIFAITAGNAQGLVQVQFPGIGAGRPGNGFTLSGALRWQYLPGDWYDATLIYRDFVYSHAPWLPEKGRPDTPARFKDIPYWICDYIPNSEKQMDARPRVLAAISERYGKDYWVDAALALKQRLGVPVAYHIYNWHEIPFNINYPHFLPPRHEAIEGMAKLKAAGLYLMPYINAVSWEMDDGDQGYPVNFANTGIHGAVITGKEPLYVAYPQYKASGEKTRLAPICPSFTPWHEIMTQVTREIERTLPVNGIYFDQVSAVAPLPCRNPAHDHAPGGGSYWASGYNAMMDTINAQKPADSFYFSECNAEVYTKSFDGFLTWVWNTGDLVPAFPTIYAGYVQMIGRYTDGANRENDEYFRFHLAQSLLFGQQLGWLNAHVVYQEKRMTFLERLVALRYAHSDLFREGRPVRPPVVETDLPPASACGIQMAQVLAGVWQRDRETVLFVINTAETPAQASLKLYPEEYRIPCPDSLSLTLAPGEVKILSL